MIHWITQPTKPNKWNWVKLGVTLIVAVIGILIQFDVTINQNVVKSSSTSIANFPAVRRAYITEGACRGIKKDTKTSELDDRFRSDPDHEIAWQFPLAEDHERYCTVYTNYDGGKVRHVTLDLIGY